MPLSGRTKASVLWGAIGALSFLVLAQAYVLVSPNHVPFLRLLGAGVVVFLAATAFSYVAEPRLTALAE